ncbi:DNA polymerase type B, organellar and viral-domain-containing protein [Suillus lakei]|nr:DNA polymerase type B, organellar and viral-domain-containing protein [Suillus lakei]
MDLETFTNNGIVIPYCVSIFDGQQSQSFYLLDFDNSDHMLIESVKFLMKRKYSGYKIYLHNFSHFDGIFLIRILSTLSDNIKPIIRDHRIIDLKFKFDNKYILYFRDSYLMLPTSLKKLAIQFNVDNKTIFPYSFVNKNNLDFCGNVPEFKYFNELKIFQYIEYKNSFDKNWSLRNESIKYCLQDCVTLYKVINEFNKQIFNLFRINIHKYPTLSSLAFAIYRSTFLCNFKIPLISGQIYDDLKKGYTGGAVDVYKPYGENIYRYDVNSLYPYIMKNSLMPVGSPVYFEGDILKIENKPYGIFFCEVIAPNNLNEPIIQKRIKSVNGMKTIAPLGKWSGVYFSGEIYNAINYGYKFKITRGYLFDSKLIFNDYVDFLYNLKINSEKGTANYTISKLLLNSLYGRFGMSPDMVNYALINSNETMNYINKYIITDILDLHNGKEIISYLPEQSSKEDNDFNNINISIPISLVTTAAARVHMSQYKNNSNYTLYYSDTDSIDINKPLSDNLIGKELGKMKLEHKFNKIIFLSSKVYGGITNDYEIVKIKGVKNPIKFENLLPLLTKDNKLIINQDKWYKSISEGKITIKDEIYTLMVTENKRKLIYDNNKLIETKPLIINDTQIINEN